MDKKQLKPCPFCGMNPKLDDSHKPECYFRRATDVVGDADVKWNTRPIEDALQAEVSKLREENEILREKLRDALLLFEEHPVLMAHASRILEIRKVLKGGE